MTDKRTKRPPPDRAGLAQIRALSHPLRLRLFELFAERPRTTKQAAEALREAPTRLYHHVAALERAGLVRLRETRPKRGTVEKYFEAVRPRSPARAEAGLMGSGRGTKDVREAGLVLFDQARMELIHTLARRGQASDEPLMMVRGLMWLAPPRARRLQAELLALLRRARTEQRAAASPGSRRGRRRYAVTVVLLPADPSAGS